MVGFLLLCGIQSPVRQKPEASGNTDTSSLRFGPISTTIASMAIISLGLSILDLPREMKAFYVLFSRLTIVGVV